MQSFIQKRRVGFCRHQKVYQVGFIICRYLIPTSLQLTLVLDQFFVIDCNDCVVNVNYGRVCSFSPQSVRFLYGIDSSFCFSFFGLVHWIQFYFFGDRNIK